MKITILQPSDPAGTVIGGIDSFVRGMLCHADADIEFELIGLTTDPLARPVGRWTTIELGGRQISFYPLFAMSDGGRQPRIPASLTFAFRSWRHLPKLHGDILEFHTLWCALPFVREQRPIACVVHNDMAVLTKGKSDIRWRHFPWLYFQIEKFLIHHIDILHTFSSPALERYKNAFSLLADRFYFTPTWADTGIFFAPEEDERERVRAEFESAWGVTPDSRVLIAVGRIDAQKDPRLMLEAFSVVARKRADVFLVWVGDGVMAEEIRALAEELGVGNKVRFAGLQPREIVAKWLRAADLYLLSSVYEGMPMAALEALASGVPVVTTDVGEVRRMVRDGVNGVVVSDRDARSFAQGMLRALDHLEGLRGLPCTEAVVSYTPAAVVREIHRHYRELLAAR